MHAILSSPGSISFRQAAIITYITGSDIWYLVENFGSDKLPLYFQLIKLFILEFHLWGKTRTNFRRVHLRLVG